jgi:Heterokaryon incompatibility protein (HET)
VVAYSPLDITKDEIRLLYSQPGAVDDEISCPFSITSLDKPQGYEALSYAWGDLTVTAPIKIDRQLYHVTVHLHTALKYLSLQRLRECALDRYDLHQSS